MTNLFPFQRLLLRAMGRFPNIMFIMCRGLTKSYIAAIFITCMAILYPGMAIGIVSGKRKAEGNITIESVAGKNAWGLTYNNTDGADKGL